MGGERALLLPGRILVDDLAAFEASAQRDLVIENPIHNLILAGLVASLIVAGLGFLSFRYIRRRRARTAP